MSTLTFHYLAVENSCVNVFFILLRTVIAVQTIYCLKLETLQLYKDYVILNT
jgi:hypothetical protein